MLIKNLIETFILEKQYRPLHSNELLDFIQRKFIEEEMSIVDYKKLYYELDKLNAEKPDSYIMNSLFLFDTLDIPS